MLDKREDQDYFGKNNRYVKELTPDDFDSIEVWKLKKNGENQCGMMIFYAPWCGFCKRAAPIWEDVAKTAGFCDWFAFNCEKYKGHIMKIKEDMPNLINGYPTIVLYKKGTPIESYTKEVTSEGLLEMASYTCK